MTKPVSCPICKKKFGLFRWRYKCSECGKTICADCSHENTFLHRRICKSCADLILKGISSIKVVKSEHVGGHNTKKLYEIVRGQNWESNSQDTIDNIKYQAYKIGANALLSLDISKNTNRNGNYYYSNFRASAQPAVIEKQDRKRNIASELEKLAILKEKGLITENEFTKAKKKLIE